MRECKEKERRFAEYIAQGLNAYQSAVSAGYAESTARHAGDWIKKNPKKPEKFKPHVVAYLQCFHSQTEISES